MEEGASVRDAISRLLLNAWRERASETEYATRIRRVLPRGVCGDVYDLSDTILSQAIIGPTINERLLSYLGHSAASAIVTYGDVLAAVASCESVLNKPLALISLLEFLNVKIFPTISCSGNEEECIRLAQSILEIVIWLQNCIFNSLMKLPESRLSGSGSSGQGSVGLGGLTGLGSSILGGSNQQGFNSGNSAAGNCSEWTKVIDLSSKILSTISGDSFYTSLLFIGRADNEEQFSTLLDSQSQLEFKFQSHQVNHLISSGIWPSGREAGERILKFRSRIEWLHSGSIVDVVSDQALRRVEELQLNSKGGKGFMSLASIVSFGAILHPASSIDITVGQMRVLYRFHGIPLTNLIRDSIRLCLMGVVDPLSGDDHKWAAFTFLKLPLILVSLLDQYESDSTNKSDNHQNNAATILEKAINEVLDFPLFLNMIDSKSNCDSIEYFTTELCKKRVLSVDARERIVTRRKNQLTKPGGGVKSKGATDDSRCGASSGPNSPKPTIILRAESTASSILNTLDVDYSNQQESLLRVLCGMISGKSFDLILCAAAATGRLGSFITKLVYFNEFNIEVISDSNSSGKSSQTRALLFDITFLMLCHIAQQYGTEIILSNCAAAGFEESFFAVWCAECLPEPGHHVRPDRILSLCEAEKVDKLIDRFIANTELSKNNETKPSESGDPEKTDSAGPELISSFARWQEVCQNAPGAIKEILLAWECDEISTEEVKTILDNVKRKMCSLPVVVSAYLCAHTSLLHHEERLKPMNLIQELMKPLSETPPPPPPPSGTDSATSSQVSEASYYKERSQLMAQIIKRMLYELSPPTSNNGNASSTALSAQHGITSTTPMWQLIEDCFNDIKSKSSVDTKATYQMNTLYSVGGPDWFVDALVRVLLTSDGSLVADRCSANDDSTMVQELPSELYQKFSIIYGLFHINLEQCALSLIMNVLPRMLLTRCSASNGQSINGEELLDEMGRTSNIGPVASQNLELTDPRATLLAMLTVMSLFGAWSERESKRHTTEGKALASKIVSLRARAKRKSSIELSTDLDSPAFKRLRLELSGGSDQSTAMDYEDNNDESSLAEDPLYIATAELFHLLDHLMSKCIVNEQTTFVKSFLEQIFISARAESPRVLKLLPPSMVTHLIKLYPEDMSSEFIIALSDTQTARARRITAQNVCQLARIKRTAALAAANGLGADEQQQQVNGNGFASTGHPIGA